MRVSCMIFTSVSRLIALSIILTSVAVAQFPFATPELARNEFQISFEAIPVFESDTSIACVYLHYRIPQNFFIYVRNPDLTDPRLYVGRGELLVELIDERNVTAARLIRPLVVTRNAVPEATLLEDDLQGFIRLTVPAGTYQIYFSVEDGESDRKFTSREHKVTTRAGTSDALDLSYPMFVRKEIPKPGEGPTYVPLNYGTDALFGTAAGFGYLVQVRVEPRAHDLLAQWKLTNERSLSGLDPLEFSGNTYEIQNGFLKYVEGTDRIVYHVDPTPAPWSLLFIPLPLEKLEQGRCTFDLTLTRGASTRKFSASFAVHWPKKPLSLRTIALAIDALHVIATKEEVDRLRSFSIARQAKAFYDFWRGRDPDTTTAYNELMAEYYRRVDHALRSFSISRETDGYKTDRGKVFILYGAPTRSDRLLGPNLVPTEVWIYEHLRKRFIFTDPRKTGAFVLMSTEVL